MLIESINTSLVFIRYSSRYESALALRNVVIAPSISYSINDIATIPYVNLFAQRSKNVLHCDKCGRANHYLRHAAGAPRHAVFIMPAGCRGARAFGGARFSIEPPRLQRRRGDQKEQREREREREERKKEREKRYAHPPSRREPRKTGWPPRGGVAYNYSVLATTRPVPVSSRSYPKVTKRFTRHALAHSRALLPTGSIVVTRQARQSAVLAIACRAPSLRRSEPDAVA